MNKETLTLLERCQREAREKFAYHIKGEKVNLPLIYVEDLDDVVANTLKQAAGALEGMKKNHGYDLPTNDFCYSEHDVNRSYDSALTEAQRLLGEDNLK